MKTKLLSIVYWIILSSYAINSNAQANTKLSNLITPTAVNAELLPNSTNARNLGSYYLGWRNLYVTQRLYMNGSSFLHTQGGTGNTFVGKGAGTLINFSGSFNTAIGDKAMYFTGNGDYNTATGHLALAYNTNGSENTANGFSTLHNNTTGFSNTAVGNLALYYNTSGFYNTACGMYALNRNTIGSNNTSVGFFAGGSYTHNHSTFLGFFATATANVTNATAIGNNAEVTGSNQVRIGNSSVTSIGGYASWTKLSDSRYKKNIKEDVPGLDFIIQLRPITYTLNVEELDKVRNKDIPAFNDNELNVARPEPSAEELAFKEANARYIHTGFMAQEVEAIAKKLNYNFSGVDAPKNDNDFYGLRYAEFVVPLVKAVQELSKQNDEQKKENIQMKIEIRNLKSEIAELKSVTLSGNSFTTSLSSASLAQNVPNPFSNSTTISYSLPPSRNIGITAQIIITDKYGKQLKQLKISGSGNGTLRVDASTLSSGTYDYSLVIDGKIISTKQMVIAK